MKLQIDTYNMYFQIDLNFIDIIIIAVSLRSYYSVNRISQYAYETFLSYMFKYFRELL